MSEWYDEVGSYWPAYLVLIILLFYLCFFFSNGLDELAQSICEEEYGMDFLGYYKGELTCEPYEPEETTNTYNGIKVKILGSD